MEEVGDEDLAPDVQMDACERDRRARAGTLDRFGRVSRRDAEPELRVDLTGPDELVRVRFDAGRKAHQDARRESVLRMERVEPVELVERIDHDGRARPRGPVATPPHSCCCRGEPNGRPPHRLRSPRAIRLRSPRRGPCPRRARDAPSLDRETPWSRTPRRPGRRRLLRDNAPVDVSRRTRTTGCRTRARAQPSSSRRSSASRRRRRMRCPATSVGTQAGSCFRGSCAPRPHLRAARWRSRARHALPTVAHAPYIDSGADTPSSPSPMARPTRADSTSHSRACVISGGTSSPIT